MSTIAAPVKILSPTDDMVFKSLLTKDCEESKIILQDIISSVIGVRVYDVVVKNNEPTKDNVQEKQERLDINCKINSGELVNIEMYSDSHSNLTSNNFKSLKNKSAYYATDLFSSQSLKGKKYDDMAKTYQITFTAYTVFKNTDKFVHEFKLKDDDNEILTEELIIIFIELSKLKYILNKPISEMTSLEKWGIFLQYASNRDTIDVLNRIIETKGEIAMGSSLLQSISQDEFEQARQMSRRKFQTDMESARVFHFSEGEAKGRIEGKIEGALESQMDIAKNMITLGMDVDMIAKATGLSVGDIQAIRVNE